MPLNLEVGLAQSLQGVGREGKRESVNAGEPLTQHSPTGLVSPALLCVLSTSLQHNWS